MLFFSIYTHDKIEDGNTYPSDVLCHVSDVNVARAKFTAQWEHLTNGDTTYGLCVLGWHYQQGEFQCVDTEIDTDEFTRYYEQERARDKKDLQLEVLRMVQHYVEQASLTKIPDQVTVRTFTTEVQLVVSELN